MLLTQWTDLSEKEWQKEKERIKKIRDRHFKEEGCEKETK